MFGEAFFTVNKLDPMQDIAFMSIKDELFCVGKLVMWGYSIVISQRLRKFYS